jgi:hypothetical protein
VDGNSGKIEVGGDGRGAGLLGDGRLGVVWDLGTRGVSTKVRWLGPSIILRRAAAQRGTAGVRASCTSRHRRLVIFAAANIFAKTGGLKSVRGDPADHSHSLVGVSRPAHASSGIVGSMGSSSIGGVLRLEWGT